MEEKTGVLIAMSGGVDSSVAAWMMVQQGWRCMGVTMRQYQDDTCHLAAFPTCCSAQDIEDAKQVAFQLDIPYQAIDFSAAFREQVIDRFVQVYESGGTPNPCVDCNRYMRFRTLIELADRNGLYYVATGHYARVEQDRESGRWLLKKALYQQKDQSYMLSRLSQSQLCRIRFPLGEMEKSQVRRIAEEQYFVTARKHDSQDICFVPDGDYGAFLERYTGKTYPPGDFLDLQGNRVGRHEGAVRYTLGQRRGLRLAMGEPVYVTGKDMAANTVTVGPDRALYTSSLLAEDMNWISMQAPAAPFRAMAKTRYRQSEQPALVTPLEKGGVRVDFDAPQRAVTPGQTVALYDGDVVIGGATIVKAWTQQEVDYAP